MKSFEKDFMRMKTEDITSVIIYFLDLRHKYNQAYQHYNKMGFFIFSYLDALERDMFLLKEKTHNIFRAKKRYKDEKIIKGNEELFDLIIASTFHEILHLKEYVYTLQAYATKYDNLASSLKKAKIEDSESDFIKYSQLIITEAKTGLPHKAMEVKGLFENAFTYLKKFISQYNTSDALIRTLFMESEVVNEYMEGGLKSLYNVMYKYGVLEGFYTVGSSFSKSGFYDKADEAFCLVINEAKNISDLKPEERNIVESAKKGLSEIYSQYKKVCPAMKS